MKGASARRERNRAEMRQLILDASQDIVAKGGIEALTIRGIANDLGYSPGAIYDYFDSKEDIVHYLYFEGSGGLASVLEDCVRQLDSTANVFAILEELGLAYRHHALTHAEMYRLVFGMMKQPREADGPAAAVALNGLDIVSRVIRRGIASGDILKVPVINVSVSTWATAHGFMSLEVTDHFSAIESLGAVSPDGGNVIEAMYLSCIRATLRSWATPQGLKHLNF